MLFDSDPESNRLILPNPCDNCLAEPEPGVSRRIPSASSWLRLTSLSLILFATLAWVGICQGQSSIQIAWDANPEPDIAGYYVYLGTTATNLTIHKIIRGKHPRHPYRSCSVQDLPHRRASLQFRGTGERPFIRCLFQNPRARSSHRHCGCFWNCAARRRGRIGRKCSVRRGPHAALYHSEPGHRQPHRTRHHERRSTSTRLHVFRPRGFLAA